MGETGKIILEGLAEDPIFRGQALHLGPFDDENRGELVLLAGSGLEGFKEAGSVLKGGDELVPVGEKDVFAVGLEGVELEGNMVENLVAGSIELVDVARG